MGWDSSDNWRSKADVLDEQLRPGRFGAGSKVLASISVKQGYFAVWEVATGERFIEVSLVERQGKRLHLKTMEEACHPYLYNCPLEYLAMVPEKNADWRAGVRRFHGVEAAHGTPAQ